jgi:23S rRNA (uracil1939-C5)-methyltransferase
MSAPSTAVGARPRPGAEVELQVDSLAHGGNGVARLDRYVVFVREALPGDRVRARVVKSKRTHAEAELVELLEPGPDRVAPRAEHPGAPWQVLRYERQLAEKESQVRDALVRLGGFVDPPVEEIEPALQLWRYRNKLEYSFGPAPDGIALGFHKRGSWSEIADVESDLLAAERVDDLRKMVRAWCREEGLSAYDRTDHTGFLRNLVVREGRRSGALQARIVTAEGDFRAADLAAALAADSVLWSRTSGLAEVTRGESTVTLRGGEAIEEQIDGLRFRISPDAFFQTNTEMAERLYALAVEMAALEGRERVFDLFCGIGTISLVVARHAGSVWGVEIVEQAVRDAIGNAALNGIDNASFFAGDVRTALRPLVERAGSPDVVVVDPPRAGLSNKVLRRVLEVAPARVVYVSCNPTTLAPNARVLVDGGYELRRVRPVDMFPQTPHIEAVALLERRPTSP